MNISTATALDLVFDDGLYHSSISYFRVARGVDAGLWMDEGGDILGDDADVILSAKHNGERIIIRH